MDEGSDVKGARRKRVSRACDRCRSKKDKCDGVRPTCSACQASGQTCSYDPHAKKRGLPEGYVRGLEKLWALSLCNIDGLEDTMLALLGGTAESASRRPQLMRLWTDDGASESLHEVWKTSRLCGALEKMLSNPDTDRTQPPPKRPREEDSDSPTGPAGEWGFRVGRGPTPQGVDAPRVVDPFLSPAAKRTKLSISSNSSGNGVAGTGDPRALQLPPRTSQLLDIYFAKTHTWFPIIAKHNILRASYLYATGPFSVGKTTPGSGDHAALWAILSYTVVQRNAIPSESGETPGDDSAAPLSKAKEFYSVARSLIPSEKERFEIGHIQALLLLTLVNVGMEDWTAAWLLSGHATRMAIAMELGIPSDARRPPEMRQGKAVFLGCFVIDSLLSVRLSRCPGMRSEDLAMVGPLEEDGLEEWNPWVDVLSPHGGRQGGNPPRRGPLLALSCFNRLVELAGVLNTMARDLSTGMHEHVFAQRILRDLKQWDDRLPLGCRLVGPDSIFPERHSTLLPHQTYLAVTYIATLLSLYSRFTTREQIQPGPHRSALEGTKKILYRALPLLSQHAENFKMYGVPPIFEFSLRSIVQGASTLRGKLESDAFPFPRWMETLARAISDLGCAWPVFSSLTTAIERGLLTGDPSSSLFHGERRTTSSQRTAHRGCDPILEDMIPMGFALNQAEKSQGDTKMALLGNSFVSGDEVDPEFTSTILGISIPVDNHYMTPQDSATEITDLPVLEELLERQTDAFGIHLDKVIPHNGPEASLASVAQPHPPTPDSSISNAIQAPGPNDTSNLAGQGAQTGTEHTSPLCDLDSLFKDLAYLDTNEWASSREEGLKDFGFIDDSTFHAFCNDPDRLVGSQPLVHPPSIADIWPPPGFFPEMFQENNEGG